MAYPDNNPKTAVGATKVPLHLVPPSAKHYLALALADGARKYGPYNWRDSKISVSVYVAAMHRHIDAFWDGEDFAEDSGVHHLAHAMACLALLLDANGVGMLQDDRPTPGAVGQLQYAFSNKNLPRTDTGD
ncbi:dATP/dGTP diphosphohydrolase domain-containing protein [Stenotrophomonas sp. AB1(2024)]|uniref:dATP/dGTP diphosphohydrolase domain-containing protein n=1 Tax=Stenotrophomonas sp. AB1(2024) TaxID=3132215 RepID=UPI0030A0B1E6